MTGAYTSAGKWSRFWQNVLEHCSPTLGAKAHRLAGAGAGAGIRLSKPYTNWSKG